MGKQYLCGALLRNIRSSLYGNQTASYFGCDPPYLERYLSDRSRTSAPCIPKYMLTSAVSRSEEGTTGVSKRSQWKKMPCTLAHCDVTCPGADFISLCKLPEPPREPRGMTKRAVAMRKFLAVVRSPVANPRLVKVDLLDLKSKMPLQKLPESAAILVWPPVALIDTLVSERRFGSQSSSPPRPPVAGSSRTVLLISVPPFCRLSFRPLCFQAP